MESHQSHPAATAAWREPTDRAPHRPKAAVFAWRGDSLPNGMDSLGQKGPLFPLSPILLASDSGQSEETNARTLRRPGGNGQALNWFTRYRTRAVQHYNVAMRSRRIPRRSHTDRESLNAVAGAAEDLSSSQRWLVRAKLDPPRQHILLIDRPQLIEQLGEVLDHRLGLIIAPAGFGKSTLLAQWRRKLLHEGVKVGWVSLDEADGDARQFLAYVIFALTAAGAGLGRLEMLAQQGLIDMTIRAGMGSILEVIGRMPERVVLILDDYHRVQSREVDDLVRDMIAGGSSNFSIVINSRARPALDLPRLLAAGQAIEVGADALRFSREETRAAVDAGMSDDALEPLFERTEGWAVAVQLARLLVRGGGADQTVLAGFTGHTGHLAAYLADQVLSKLGADVQEFLMRTSILERFGADLANAVCERADGWEMLRRLEPLHALLVPLDERGEWFRYHHLFAECLQDLMRQRHPQLLGRLHVLATNWFAKEGYVSEAVRHARLAGNFDRCAALIEDSGGWELILFGGIGYLRSLLRNIPDKELPRFPRLQVALAYLHLKDGDVRGARALFDAAETNPLREGSGPALERDLLNVGVLVRLYEDRWLDPTDIAHLDALRTRVSRDDGVTLGVLDCARTLALLAVGQFLQADVTIRQAMREMRQANSVLGLNYCYLHSGLSSFYQGRFRCAEADYAEARRLAEDNFGADSGLKYISDVLLGALLYWRGDLGRVEREQFQRALAHVEQFDGWLEIYAMGLGVDLEIGLDGGDSPHARASIERAHRIAAQRGIERLAHIADSCQLKIFARAGHRDHAIRIAEALAREHPLGCWRQEPFRWRAYIEVAPALASREACNDGAARQARLDDAVECSRTLGSCFHLIRALIARALLHDQRGMRRQAVADLLEALQLGAVERIRQPFLAAGRAVGVLLRAAHRRGREEALSTLVLSFAAELLGQLTPQPCNAGEPAEGLLSPREREVLRELCAGLSNKKIARALDMTEHTVKFHLKNIFQKLDVDRRAHAVAEALRLNLLY